MLYVEYLKTIDRCPFCDDVRERKIAENDTAILTYSIAPYHKDHLLVIPKRHRVQLSELSDMEEGDIDKLKKLALELLNRAGYSNVSILIHGAKDMGKSIPHLHHDVVPNVKYYGDKNAIAERVLLTIEEQIEIREKFRRLL